MVTRAFGPTTMRVSSMKRICASPLGPVLEARFRLTDTIGVVPFIDAGAAYEDPIPDFGQDVSIGAGVGLRYHTPLGPLRFDVAVPLNREDHPIGFDSVAFYVGLGQSF